MNQTNQHDQVYSLRGHYDFNTVVQYLNKIFQRNIKFGLMIPKFLENIPQKILLKAIAQLIQQYKNQQHGKVYTDKLHHIIPTLKLIQKRKFNFYQWNVKEAHQLNDHYFQIGKEKLIKSLPQLSKNFVCQNCGKRVFKDRLGLVSHLKACLKINNQEIASSNTNASPLQNQTKIIVVDHKEKCARVYQNVLKKQIIDEQQKIYTKFVQSKKKGFKRTKQFIQDKNSEQDGLYEGNSS